MNWYAIADWIKSHILVRMTFNFFSLATSQIFFEQKFCLLTCSDVLLRDPSNLHDLYSVIDNNECFMLP